jgi:periodic tryptophan protein 1
VKAQPALTIKESLNIRKSVSEKNMEETVQTVTSVLWLPSKCLASAKIGGRRTQKRISDDPESTQPSQDDDIDVEDSEKAESTNVSAVDELGPEFNMDKYDEEDETDRTHLFSVIDADMKLAQEKDDYMNDEVSDSEDEDYYDIRDNDVLFVAANVEEDACTVEVYLHDTFDGGMYVHHDFLISSYPLSLEYIPTLGSKQSLLAIGAFDPKIDIWELSVHDPIEPITQLGKKKGHTDAVISLHLCPQNPTVLASGSADSTVRLWDLQKETCATSLKHHTDKVQSVRWHPIEAGILLTAAYDKKVVLTDQRSGNASSAATLTLESDPECTSWSRHSPTVVMVSDEKGNVAAHDMRKMDVPLWQIKAHEKGPCTSFTDAAGHPDLLITAGLDGVANVWNSSKCATQPELVFSRDLKAGPLFSVSSCNDDPALFVFGASCPVLWNITDTDVVCKTFPSLPGADQPNLLVDDDAVEDGELDD